MGNRQISGWGVFWITIALAMVAAMIALWVLYPPRCTDGWLCMNEGPRAHPAVEGFQTERAQERPRVAAQGDQGIEAAVVTQEPSEDHQDSGAITASTQRPQAASGPGNGHGHDKDKPLGWERHGKPTPPGHGGSPPGQGHGHAHGHDKH